MFDSFFSKEFIISNYIKKISAVELIPSVISLNRVGGKERFYHCEKCGKYYFIIMLGFNLNE